MTSPTLLSRLWNHLFWADGELLRAILSGSDTSEGVMREFAHIIGAEEVWLARLENRSPLLAVWPSISSADLESAVLQTHKRWKTYIAGLRETDFEKPVHYTNSDGRHFDNSVEDILLHVALHGQYHRGKVNLMLRSSGRTPAPIDYIAYVREAPAATEGDAS